MTLYDDSKGLVRRLREAGLLDGVVPLHQQVLAYEIESFVWDQLEKQLEGVQDLLSDWIGNLEYNPNGISAIEVVGLINDQIDLMKDKENYEVL